MEEGDLGDNGLKIWGDSCIQFTINHNCSIGKQFSLKKIRRHG